MNDNAFEQRLTSLGSDGLHSEGIDTVQVNVGRRCNLSCTHCHLNCSPDRSEMMSRSVMDQALRVIDESSCSKVDITGGSPELHPELRPLIAELKEMGKVVQLRTNLTNLLDPSLEGLIDFLRENKIELVASLPCYTVENVDAQRGDGSYQKCIATMRCLNEVGYATEADLVLDLVYNPAGAFLPGSQDELEAAYKRELDQRFGIKFNNLLVITNMPIGRFRETLDVEGKARTYMRMLVDAFNPEALKAVMCKRQVCIDWDGTLYDCDFNLALGLSVNHDTSCKIGEFSSCRIGRRRIVTGEHCFGCTAGAGSSCGGALT